MNAILLAVLLCASALPQGAAAEEGTEEHFAFGVEYDWSNMNADFESMTGLPLDDILGDVMQSADDAGMEMLILEEITGTSSMVIDQYDAGTMMFDATDGSSVEVTKHVTELTVRHGMLADMALITEWSDARAGWDLTISAGSEGIFNIDAYYVEYRDASGLIYGHDVDMSMDSDTTISFDLEGSLEAEDGDKVMPLDIHMEMGVAYGVTNAASSMIYAEPSTLHQRISDLQGGESLEWSIGQDDSEVYWNNYQDCEWDGYDYRCAYDNDDDGNADIYVNCAYCEYYSSSDEFFCTWDFGNDENWENAVAEGWTHYNDGTSPNGHIVIDEVESNIGTFSTSTGFNFELTGLPAEEMGFPEGKWDVSASDDTTDAGGFDEEDYGCEMGMELFEGTQMITTDGEQIEVMQAHTSPVPFGMTCHIYNLFSHAFVGTEDAATLEDMIADSTEEIAESLDGNDHDWQQSDTVYMEMRVHSQEEIDIDFQAWNLDMNNNYEVNMVMVDSDGITQDTGSYVISDTDSTWDRTEMSTSAWGEHCTTAQLKHVTDNVIVDSVTVCADVSQEPEPSDLVNDIIEGFGDSTIENTMENFAENLEYRLEGYEADIPYDDGEMFILWDDTNNMVVGFQMVVTSDDSNLWHTLIGPESDSYGDAPSTVSMTYFSGQQAIIQEAEIEDDTTLADLVDLSAHNDDLIDNAIEESLSDNGPDAGGPAEGEGNSTTEDVKDGLLPFISPVMTMSMIAVAGLVVSLRTRKE